MMDREKVISALDCRANNTDLYCSICEYFRKNADDKIPFCDFGSILNDALSLLKEQEAEWLEVDDKHDAFDCSNCGAMAGRKCLYCPGCGAKMKNGTRAMEGW